MSKPILCLDFDGVIHSYASGWRGAEIIPDPPVPGAIQWLLTACDHFTVHIYSSRSSQPGGIEAMKAWLRHWARDAHAVLHPDETKHGLAADLALMRHLHWPTEKPAAFVTIDDRALTFNGNWSDPAWAPERLLAFKPWNKS